jgi:hypothetical protein
MRGSSSHLIVNEPILIKGRRIIILRGSTAVDLVNNSSGGHRLGAEGRLVVLVHQACP